ncbi:U3 snoRNP protein [Saxophila tyrrhenica]|uniref:U3 snoRNP protein n=1 Tax=Saxophila tyrrhenica TaxID=1690608 RepID=A0AAV9PAX3_9PEZI|nr:U3 snoRNP protein [Saxophila tyrrhenica]
MSRSQRRDVVDDPEREESEAEERSASDESDVEIEIDEPEKDESEEELEQLVFGDSAGFRRGLAAFADERDGEDEEDAADTGFAGLDDADLFFTDVGQAGQAGEVAETSADDEKTLRSRYPAAWEDSDDERMMVSLASVPRLRKLRRTEAEDVVNGKEYARRLRQQFELLNPAPEWARHALQQPALKKRRLSGKATSDEEDSDVDMDTDDDVPSAAPLSKLLRDAEGLVRSSRSGAGKKRKLRPEAIDIQRAKDIPGTQPSAVTSISFHPQIPLLLTSGPSSTLYLHHLASSPPAPTPNPLLTSMHIRGTPLSTTAFHPTDGRIFLSARRRYFHIWNLDTGRVEKITRIYGQQHEQRSMETFKLSPNGKFMALLGSARKGGGIINILNANSLQWICQVRVESRNGIADFAWWRDSKGMSIAGKNGEITEWSVLDRRITARWQDEGAVGITTIALGGQHEFVKSTIGTDRWIVVGSSSGIVNIYDRRVWLASASKQDQPVPSQPKPTKVLDQLTTPTSHLTFSPDGQLLAISSKWKANALRLVHLPSCAVFRNWPTGSTPLGRISGVAIAGGEVVGGDVHSVLAVGNEQGRVRCWEVR